MTAGSVKGKNQRETISLQKILTAHGDLPRAAKMHHFARLAVLTETVRAVELPEEDNISSMAEILEPRAESLA
jgi:hypothetical protein